MPDKCGTIQNFAIKRSTVALVPGKKSKQFRIPIHEHELRNYTGLTLVGGTN